MILFRTKISPEEKKKIQRLVFQEYSEAWVTFRKGISEILKKYEEYTHRLPRIYGSELADQHKKESIDVLVKEARDDFFAEKDGESRLKEIIHFYPWYRTLPDDRVIERSMLPVDAKISHFLGEAEIYSFAISKGISLEEAYRELCKQAEEDKQQEECTPKSTGKVICKNPEALAKFVDLLDLYTEKFRKDNERKLLRRIRK